MCTWGGSTQDIRVVVQDRLCTGCGTCAGTCPYNSISMIRSDPEGFLLPRIDQSTCRRCGLCVRVCPGHSINLDKLASEVFGKQPENKLLGNLLRCYVGHSQSYETRYNSASGGLVTEVLVFALENKIIDGALVCRMRDDRPLETEAFIARNREELVSAAKSKYCPVATNEALRRILKEDGRFAVVGLPCHIHGIRQAERIFKGLNEKIVLHLGLMCSHTVGYRGTEFVLKKSGVEKEKVRRISYRGKGWPGCMSIQTKDGKSLDIPLVGSWNAYWPVFSSFFFTPLRCIMCPDQNNELADVSFGDAWLPELRHDKVGKSIIVTRTTFADEILDRMSLAGRISIKRIQPEKVEQSQAFNLRFKKTELAARLAVLEKLGKKTPNLGPKPCVRISSLLPIGIFRALFPYVGILVTTNDQLLPLIRYLPIPFFRAYFGAFKFLSRI